MSYDYPTQAEIDAAIARGHALRAAALRTALQAVSTRIQQAFRFDREGVAGTAH